MPVFSFRTIKASSEGKYKEKGSVFHAFAFPVETENEVKEHVMVLKKKFFDARHHCFAYVLGLDRERVRAFDDGEPNHSAGSPILGQIRAKDLTNVLIVVVRYFGGVKLGVGGLMAAYKAAAIDALDHAGVEERDVMTDVIIHYNYEDTPEVMRLVKDFDLKIVTQQYESHCSMEAKLKLSQKEKFDEKIEFLRAIKILIEAKTK
jgi:uncharacterized YigZ family protein